MNAELCLEGAPDAVAVVVTVETGQACGKQVGTPLMKIRTIQIGRRPVERVEERTGQRCEDRIPAKQAEQRDDQGILDVVDRRTEERRVGKECVSTFKSRGVP